MRKIFLLFYNIFAKNLPISNSKLSFGSKVIRAFFIRRAITYMGKNVNIDKNASIPIDFKIGNNSGVGQNCIIGSNVTIGSNVMMGPDVKIYTRNHEFKNIEIPMIQQGYQEIIPLIIEDDVWIGANVIITPSVKIIQRGSIIAAGSVVTKDINEYSIVAGNPARVVRYRKK